MPAIIIPDRWDKKPSGIPFIDWSNPITTGLRYFVLLDAARFNINLVTQALLGGVLEPGVVLSKESITTAATALGKLQLDISKSSWVGTYAVSSIHLSGTVDWMFASNTAWDGLYTDGTNVNLTSNLGFGGTGAPVGEKKNTRFSRVCVAIPSANDFRSISGTGPVSVDTSAALPIGAMTKVFFGSDYSGANHAAAEVEYFAIWDRVLPDAEMRAFNAAPYQVVKKPSRILYFPSAGGGATIAGDSGTYALTGSDVSLKAGRKLAADSGSYSLSGTDAAFKRGYALVASSGTYTVSGTAVSLKAGRKLAADSGSYTLTGTDATLTYAPAGSYNLTAESGSYSLTGTAATLKVSRKLSADSGAYSLTGTTATLAKGVRMAAASGSYTLTGSNVSFARTYVLTAESGSYTLTGTSAGLTWSGAPVVEVPTNGGPSIYGKPVFREREFRREYEEQVKRIEDEKRLARILREDEEIICIMALMAA